MLARHTVRLLRIPPREFPTVLEQLVFEERLFRRTSDSWCIFSEGKKEPAVVMGLSGKPGKMLNMEKFVGSQASAMPPVPVIRRFSGGGTVVVDHNTLFVSWVCSKDVLPRSATSSPPALMRWSAEFYGGVLERCRRQILGHQLALADKFGLQEHDYCIGTRKFGGNAQCLTRNRFVHHTSFLWDFDPGNMQYLALPEKRPAYRDDRDHNEFLCRLRDYVVGGDRAAFEGAIVGSATSTFDCVWTSMAEAREVLDACQDDSSSAQRISTHRVLL
jgi:lipoate-protein ligase A